MTSSKSAKSKHASDHTRKRISQPLARSQSGVAYTSPKKSRPTGAKAKVQGFGLDLRLHAMKSRMAELEAASQAKSTAGTEIGCEHDDQDLDISPAGPQASPDPGAPFSSAQESPEQPGSPSHIPAGEEMPLPFQNVADDVGASSGLIGSPPAKRRRTKASRKANKQYQRWMDLLPALIGPYLRHIQQTYQATALPPVPNAIFGTCSNGPQCDHPRYARTVLCLFMHRKLFTHLSPRFILNVFLYSRPDFQSVRVTWCQDTSLPIALIEQGLFPSAPSQPHIAFSLELLSFFCALFTKSTDAVNSMAAALNSHYRTRGFRLAHSDVSGISFNIWP